MTQVVGPRIKGWTLFFCGLCMGTADLIPGISGGTIAFILGFYQPLLDSLKSFNWSALKQLLTGHWQRFAGSIQWKFLLTLLSGIGCAFVCLANLFHTVLSHEIFRVYLYATFFGLIIASFVFCLRQVTRWTWKTAIALLAGAAIAFFLTESTLSTSLEGEYAIPLEIKVAKQPLRNYDSELNRLFGLSPQSIRVLLDRGVLADETPVYDSWGVQVGFANAIGAPQRSTLLNGWLVVCGAFAVCALLLPGISGSYILTLLGVYGYVIEALVDFINGLRNFSFNVDAFAILASLGLGIILGAIAFARAVSWLLKKYPNITLALLSGFMIGAIRSVWPFWSYEYMLIPLKLLKGPQLIPVDPYLPSLASPLTWLAVLCALAGFSLVFGLESYMQRKSFSKDSHEAVYQK